MYSYEKMQKLALNRQPEMGNSLSRRDIGEFVFAFCLFAPLRQKLLEPLSLRMANNIYAQPLNLVP